MRHRPALDGIRGFAVLAVLAFHSFALARGGDLGVGVFFVLSGFLITGLLLEERQVTSRIDLRKFYIRRALRLGPALVMLLALAAVLLVVEPALRARFHTSVVGAFLATTLYVNNWLNVAAPDSTGLLGHTWTLSVEEQFYLLWPVALIWLLKRRARTAPEGDSSPPSLATWLWPVIAALILGRAAWWLSSHSLGVWFATTSRADQLLIGCLAATAVRRSWGVGWLPAGGALLTLAGLVVLTNGRDPAQQNLGMISVVGLLSVVVIAHVGSRDSGPVVALLSWPPLVAVGKVSYGLYLYHWPIFQWVAVQPGWSHAQRFAVEYAATAIATVVSYAAIERPALRLKGRFAVARPAA